MNPVAVMLEAQTRKNSAAQSAPPRKLPGRLNAAVEGKKYLFSFYFNGGGKK